MAMNANAQQLLENVMRLPALDRASVAEELLSSLDTPDSAIDKLWAEEAEARVDAYERGEMGTVSADDVFGKHKKL
jgi:putative addiction module component (TIGR02574 family)